MNPCLQPVVTGLATLNDSALAALIDVANGVPQIASGLPASIEGACDWELNRRHGLHFLLQPPDAAIEPSQDAVSIAAAVIIRAQSAQDDWKDAGTVAMLFDATIRVLSGGERRH